MTTWLLVGILQPVFVALVFVQRGRRDVASVWLFSWLAVAFLHQLGIYLGFAAPDALPAWLSIGAGLLPLLHGPVAFAYVAQALPASRAGRYPASHLLAFLFMWILFALVSMTGWQGWTVDTTLGISTLADASGQQIALSSWLMALSGGGYPLLALWLLRSHRNALEATRSNVESVRLRWVEIWVWGHLSAFGLIFAAQMLMPMDLAMPIASWVLAAEVFYLGAFGVHHFDRSAHETSASPGLRQISPTLDEDTSRLVAHMASARPWQSPGLTLSELSASSGLAETTLTDAIRHAGYSHFFDFVNTHRCDAVKAQLDDRPGQTVSILNLALEAGFNSKTAFNRVFKAQTGLTPTQYRTQTKSK
jgi:AraC-like DNA-binding protein